MSARAAIANGDTGGRALLRRSVVKALTYRALIMCLDFAAIYLFTGALKIALGFMVASNVYTSIAYVLHERAWARVTWGRGATITPVSRAT